MADSGLSYEIWTPVGGGDFKRKFDVSRWVLEGTTLDLRFVDLSAGILRISNQCPGIYLNNILAVDRANHANDVGSTLMVFRDGVWITAMVPTRKRVNSSNETEPWWEFQLEGLEWYLDRARVKAWDYPADPIREGDWLYGAASIIPDAGNDLSDDIYFLDVSGASSGTYTITDGVDTTANINWNETNPTTIKTRLETDIASITSCVVSGTGIPTFPFIIRITDPQTDHGLTVNNATNGTVTLEQTTAGGSPSPRPWHGSVDGNTGIVIGNYDQFDLVTAGVGGVPSAPPGSPSTELLRIDASNPDGAGDFAGAQVEVEIPPDHRHRSSIDVWSLTAQTIRLVFRTLTEGEIARDEQTLTASTWTTLSIPEMSVPVGTGVIVMRIGIIENGDADVVYLDVNNATLAPGGPPAPLGEIATDLLAPMVARSVLDWMTETWSDTLDSASVAWDRSLSQGIRKGQSFMQFLEYESRWGYERRITYKGTVGAGDTFDLELFNPGGADDVPLGVSVSAIDHLIAASPVEEAAPSLTTAIAEGAEGSWGEYTDAALATAFGKLEGYFANKQGRESTNLDALAQQMVADSATETISHQVTVQNPAYLFGADFRIGDTIPVAVYAADGSITPDSLRLVGCVITETDTLPTYTYSFGAVVFDAEQAQADAIRTLIRQYRALDEIGSGAVVDPITTYLGGGGGSGGATVVVAAFNASSISKGLANLQCDGVDDHVEIQQAFDMLGPYGGNVITTEGDFNINGQIVFPDTDPTSNRRSDVALEGWGSRFNHSEGASFKAFNYTDSGLIRVSGIVFTGGVEPATQQWHLFHLGAGTIHISDCWFKDLKCQAVFGAASLLYFGKYVVSDCVFSNITITGTGNSLDTGGLFRSEGAGSRAQEMYMTNCRISGFNKGTHAGAVFLFYCQTTNGYSIATNIITDLGAATSGLVAGGAAWISHSYVTNDARPGGGPGGATSYYIAGEHSNVTNLTGNIGRQFTTFTIPGAVPVGTSDTEYPFSVPGTIYDTKLRARVAPSGGPLNADVMVNGTSIYTTAANPTLADGVKTSADAPVDGGAVGVVNGDILTVAVDLANGAQNLVFVVEWEPTI